MNNLTPSPLKLVARWLRKHVKLVITAVLLTYVACNTQWSKVAQAFVHMRVELWLAALAVLVGSQLLSAWRWQVLARPFGFERSVRQLASYYFIGMYFNLMLPTAVGGDVVRAWYLDAHSGKRLAAYIAVFVDRFSGLTVLLTLGCVGVLFCPQVLPAWIPWLVFGTTSCAVAALAIAPWLARKNEGKLQPLRKIRIALQTLRAPRLLLVSTLLSLGVQASNVVLVWLVGKAIGVEVPDSYYWVMVPMVSLLGMMPVSINAIGVRENATVLFLAPLGVPADKAVALALLWFAVFLAGSLLGGLVYLFGQFPRPAAGSSSSCAPAGELETELTLADDMEVNHGSICSSADQGRTRQRRAAA